MTLLLGAAIAVLLIYLLRPPAQKILVPSSLLWEQLVKETANRRRLLRWLLSLLLSALIVLLLISMIFRLEPRTGSVLDPVLLVDNTGSMGTLTNVGQTETRLDLAKRRATEILGRSTGTITIADLAGTVGPVRLNNAAEARRVIGSIRFVPATEPRVPEQLYQALDAAPGGVFLLTDNSSLLEELRELTARANATNTEGSSNSAGGAKAAAAPAVELVNVHRAAANIGITDFSLSAEVKGTVDLQPDSAYLEVLNGGDGDLTARLRLDVFQAGSLLETDLSMRTATLASREPLLTRDLTVAAGEEWSAALDLESAHRRFPLEPIAVRASIFQTDGDTLIADAQPLDDTAWIVLQPKRTRLVATSGVGSLPTWLTRILRTSSQLEVVRSQPTNAAPAVHLYSPSALASADATPPIQPCMVLPPELGATAQGVSVIEAERVLFSPSESTAGRRVRLPWTQLVIRAGEPDALKRTDDKVWLWAELSEAAADQASINPEPDGGNNPARSDAITTTTVSLILGPTRTNSGSAACTRWLFDPLASQLDTRAEFPALVERVIAATAGTALAQRNSSAWNGQRRELIAGTWRQMTDDRATPGAGLRLFDNRLSVPDRLGVQMTRVGAAPQPTGAAQLNDPLAESTNLDPALRSMGTDPVGSNPLLGWPGRAALAGLVILLLVAEAATRFSGVTE